MLFDAEIYSEFVESLRKEKVDMPIIPGIFPITAKWKLKLIETNFKIKVPQKIKKELNKLDQNEFKKRGIEIAVNLCKELKKRGAPGIHLFIFQDLDLAYEIFSKLKNDN